MLALLLANVVVIAPAPEAPNLGVVCKAPAVVETSLPVSPMLLLRPQDRAAIQPRRLGDLPKPNLEIAVLRQDLNGCVRPVVVGYNVGP